MRNRWAVAVLAGVLAAAEGPAAAQAASSAKAFKYKGGRIEAGVVNAYDRSDAAGTKTGSVLVYMPDRKRLEVLSVTPGNDAAQLVTGEMDWDTFSLGRFEVWREGADGARSRVAVGSVAGGSIAVTVEDPALYRGRPGANAFSVPLAQVPSFVASFDLVPLALALRHLADAKGSVEVGLVAENVDVSAASPAWLVPAGKLTVAYAEDVNRDGIDCSKYSVSGPALGEEQGALWYDLEKGHLRAMELPIRSGEGWADLALYWRGSDKATEKDWATRREVEIRKVLRK